MTLLEAQQEDRKLDHQNGRRKIFGIDHGTKIHRKADIGQLTEKLEVARCVCVQDVVASSWDQARGVAMHATRPCGQTCGGRGVSLHGDMPCIQTGRGRGVTLHYSRVKPRDKTLEPTDRAVALPSPGQTFLFFGPCGVVKSILYRNRRPVGRLERLVDESHSVVLSEASSRGFIVPFGRCVAGKVLEYFRLRPISRGYSAPARNPDGGCIGDLESAHHTAMMDTVNLSRSQRLLVADATRLAREGSENVAVRDVTECARDGQSGAVPVDSITLRARAVLEQEHPE
ncbi:hypothetical protein F2Q68_00019821 [Brassica cretica]|uniref:Uncharacterized protein n=1 Tax=Brassica cretica TaxID=69181 RepID=A0A8S9FW81_BRACR|nr:hypothetical protein F2Q68_00019821 [Brassica cretica]